MAKSKLRTSVLEGKKVLVACIANDSSIAWGCAKAFHELGAEVAITYLNEKSRPFVEPLAKEVKSPLFLPLDVSKPGELEELFKRIKKSGANSMSLSTRSPRPRRRTSRASCLTVRPTVSRWPWTSRSIPSSAWRSSPHR